jgi:uncharacterized membrane protein
MILKRLMDLLLLSAVIVVAVLTWPQATYLGYFNLKIFLFNFSFMGFIPLVLIYVLRLFVYGLVEKRSGPAQSSTVKQQKSLWRYIEFAFLLLLIIPTLIMLLTFTRG